MNFSTKRNKKMSLPDQVWVMGHKWTIEATNDDWLDDTDSWGECCSRKRRIRVYTKGGGSITRDTLLHEILHACWNILALEQKEEEERVVNSMASILIGLIDDPRNKDIVNFIIGKTNDNGPTTS